MRGSFGGEGAQSKGHEVRRMLGWGGAETTGAGLPRWGVWGPVRTAWGKRPSVRVRGQALVEMIVVLPVLLLLLLAAADMGKFFVISGKTEIAARYVALREFRGAPFGDLYPGLSEAQEIERIFFDDALDDNGLPEGEGSESDDPDVTFRELTDEELSYAPGDLGNPVLTALWDYFDATEDLLPIRGVRATFHYDLPRFPYGRIHPLEETEPLQEGAASGRLASGYDANGDFVMLAEAFTGEQGEALRLFMEEAGLVAGFSFSRGALAGLAGILLVIFLP